VPGKTTKPESIRPGSRTLCSTCESAVSQEVLAPFGVARSLSFLNRVDSAGRARGLCGAPVGARGRRPSPEDLHRLDPDGWLVQSSIDTNSIESPAEQRRTRGENEKCVIPQPRGHRPSFPDSVCLLDTRLLMGGTDIRNERILPSSRSQAFPGVQRPSPPQLFQRPSDQASWRTRMSNAWGFTRTRHKAKLILADRASTGTRTPWTKRGPHAELLSPDAIAAFEVSSRSVSVPGTELRSYGPQLRNSVPGTHVS
jgi:hypothetical protein